MDRYLLRMCLLLLLPCNTAGNTCSAINFQKRKRLDGYLIVDYETDKFTNCANECSLLTHCVSVNYHLISNICQLNSATSVTHPGNIVLDNVYTFLDIADWPKSNTGPCSEKPCSGRLKCLPAKTTFMCVETDCPEPKPYISDYATITSGDLAIGTIRTYECSKQHEIRIGSENKIQCGMFKKWTRTTNFICKKPSTCAEAATCSPASDGEYWLYPGILNGEKVKIYCHGMQSGNPTEYVTVSSDRNYAHFDYEGLMKTSFSRIRVNIQTLTIIADEYTHAISTGESDTALGVGNACSLTVDATFSIDTTNTGLIVKPNIQWTTYGGNAVLQDFSRSFDNQRITGTCGGNCGGCWPDGELSLVLNYGEVISESEATHPSC